MFIVGQNISTRNNEQINEFALSSILEHNRYLVTFSLQVGFRVSGYRRSPGILKVQDCEAPPVRDWMGLLHDGCRTRLHRFSGLLPHRGNPGKEN